MLTDKLTSALGIGGSIVMAGALVFVWISKEATISSLEGQIENISADRDLYKTSFDDCKANQRILEVTIESQNDAINQVKSASAARVEALEQVADNAENNAARARREAQRIMNSKASTENLCDAANSLILEEVQ